jgi:hypothetical protein
VRDPLAARDRRQKEERVGDGNYYVAGSIFFHDGQLSQTFSAQINNAVYQAPIIDRIGFF